MTTSKKKPPSRRKKVQGIFEKHYYEHKEFEGNGLKSKEGKTLLFNSFNHE
jgi:hypothetical protein